MNSYLQQSFPLNTVDTNGIVTINFGAQVIALKNDKCPVIAADLLKVITSIKQELFKIKGEENKIKTWNAHNLDVNSD